MRVWAERTSDNTELLGHHRPHSTSIATEEWGEFELYLVSVVVYES